MKILVKYFGNFWNLTQKKEETLEVTDDSTIKDALNKLVLKYGEKFRENLLDSEKWDVKPFNWVLINGKDIRQLQGIYTKLNSDDKIALLHPVGGGGKRRRRKLWFSIAFAFINYCHHFLRF